ncbi:hypothetical protein D9757_015182 [Collybiopsis confluens]|uniref:DUF4219 domain-containing protein n=1 Tax=Collybiopsis confluens TaxID=2823264 RepID=A0A8H5FZY4_9AGAR|nr:hypothetical protein D9757_015182 [Collybiopsis confluens]
MSETIKFAKLSNSNYNDWKSDMQAHLGEHGLWRLVCGKEPMPTKADLVEDWETKAILAYSKILELFNAEELQRTKDEQSVQRAAASFVRQRTRQRWLWL